MQEPQGFEGWGWSTTLRGRRSTSDARHPSTVVNSLEYNCCRGTISLFSPEGTTDNSPGRKPWVCEPFKYQSPGRGDRSIQTNPSSHTLATKTITPGVTTLSRQTAAVEKKNSL